MHRTQILLSEDQYQALKSRARREGRSLSELIRTAVSEWLGDTKRKEPARLEEICSLATDPGGPEARDHDSLLYQWKRKK